MGLLTVLTCGSSRAWPPLCGAEFQEGVRESGRVQPGGPPGSAFELKSSFLVNLGQNSSSNARVERSSLVVIKDTLIFIQ